MAQTKKHIILSTASELFYKQGIRATGIDQIIAESGVAKMTLYKHFPSKDDLIQEFLKNRDENWRNWFESAVRKIGASSGNTVTALFDCLEKWFQQPEFNGCAFINTAAEFTDVSHPHHQISLLHKKRLKEFISDLVNELGIKDADSLTETLYLLVEGAIVTAMMEGEGSAARHARAAAELVLKIYFNKE